MSGAMHCSTVYPDVVWANCELCGKPGKMNMDGVRVRPTHYKNFDGSMQALLCVECGKKERDRMVAEELMGD